MDIDFKKEKFHSATHGELSLSGIILKIKEFLEEVPSSEYSLVIGTDSHEKNTTLKPKDNAKEINLVTAILIHRKGFGGKYFWRRQDKKNIHSLREKIYAETLTSLTFASVFVPLFQEKLNGRTLNYNLEIHVDVGEHGATREMIKEVVGMVTGSGFIAKTKPESYCASYVADKHT